jgi:UPF0755 protein
MTLERIQLTTIAGFIFVGLFVYLYAFQAPSDFPVGSRFEVGEGESLRSISGRLEQEHIIGSALLFRGWISLIGRDNDIDLGAYVFERKLSLPLVVAKFVKGPDEPLLSVTIPEGYTTEEIASAFKKAIPTLSSQTFIQKVKNAHLDGYLFPATYYPLPSFDEEAIIAKMKSVFDREYQSHFAKESYPPNLKNQTEVLSLAAILEAEAKTPEDMKIIAGILQKRLAQGLRLQVDAAPSTYKTGGLPSIPINNPGLVAIASVFHPTTTAYLYYLTGNDGTMHYAKTYEEHKKNIQKYLR